MLEERTERTLAVEGAPGWFAGGKEAQSLVAEAIAYLLAKDSFSEAELMTHLCLLDGHATAAKLRRSIGVARRVLCRTHKVEFRPGEEVGVFKRASAREKFDRSVQFGRTATKKLQASADIARAIGGRLDTDLAARVERRLDKLNELIPLTAGGIALRRPPLDASSAIPDRLRAEIVRPADLPVKKPRKSVKKPRTTARHLKPKNKVTK